MIGEKKANTLSRTLDFLFKNEESGLVNKEVYKILKNLNIKIQSAMIYNMEIFRSERKKELDKQYKLSNEESIESSALRVAKNDSNVENTHDIRFDSTELWRIQKHSQNFDNELDDNRVKAKSRKREGLFKSSNRIIHFDREIYERQMNELKANPENFELLRTSHVPSEVDKDLLINQYLKNQRRKSTSASLDVKSDIYHINQGNREYNEKLDRAYQEFTTEIKQNLERGTAL